LEQRLNRAALAAKDEGIFERQAPDRQIAAFG
jgi:hypothetical protein